jgi:DNA-binding MarR family transcriptional regulator
MALRLEDLSVNERILIYLRDYSGSQDQEVAVVEQTQEGISEAVGIRINHVPRASKKLIDDGYVEERLLHVGGLKRKRRAYTLTRRGQQLADEIISKVRNQEVPFRETGGQENMLTINDITFRAKGRATISKIVLVAFKESVILESALASEKKLAYLSTLGDVPDPIHFYDRDSEKNALLENISKNKRVIIISGMRGVGKSSLAKKAFKEIESTRNIIWYSAHDWDTPQSILENLADFFVRLGRNELKKLIRGVKKLDVNLAVLSLIKDMIGSNTIIVLDNVFNLKGDVMQMIFMICENAKSLNDSHFVLITRDRDALRSTPCLGGLGGPNEINLKGLEQKWAMKMMAELGMQPEDMERVYGMTNGHPLALELVNSDEIKALIDTKGLTKEEIWVVRCLKAFDAIFG